MFFFFLQDIALNSFKNLRISPGKTDSSSGSRKGVNVSSVKKLDNRNNIMKYIESEKEKKASSKDESSLTTAPENHENINGKYCVKVVRESVCLEN